VEAVHTESALKGALFLFAKLFEKSRVISRLQRRLKMSDCERCGGSEVENFFFKNEAEKTVRSVSLPCKECFPGSTGTASAKGNEVEIDSTEGHRLLYVEGWEEKCD
jgi:hypothetical protein